MRNTSFVFIASSLFITAAAIISSCNKKDSPSPASEPVFSSFSPAEAAEGASVIISGNNFPEDKTKSIVKFNGIAAIVTDAQKTELTVTVPDGATTGKITVAIDDKKLISATDFKVNPGAPIVSAFTPEKGDANTEITITGKRFVNGCKVYFGGIAATTVTYISATSLKARVPENALTGKIKVTSDALESFSATDFTATPRITAVSTFNDIEGAEILITGANFNTVKAQNTIKFGTGNATAEEITAVSPTEIKVKAPVAGTDGKITVTVAGLTATTGNDFIYKPSITDFTPKYGERGTAVTLTGKRFGDNPLVTINSITARITSKSETEIRFTIPDNEAVTGDQFTLKSKFTTLVTDEMFEVTNIWKKINDGNNQILRLPVSFVWNNKIYYGLGGSTYGFPSSTFNVYNPSTNTWSSGPTLPAADREGATAVAYGNKIYIGGGLSDKYLYDWWEYTPSAPEATAWKKLADLPYSGTDYPGYTISFVVKNRIFEGLGTNCSSLFEYFPATDTWSTSIYPSTGPRTQAVSFVKNNVAYIGGGVKYASSVRDFYAFDPEAYPTAHIIQELPGGPAESSPVFEMNGDTYLMNQKSLYRFNAIPETWTLIANYSTPIAIQKIHTINNRVYGIGSKHQVYEYIPNK